MNNPRKVGIRARMFCVRIIKPRCIIFLEEYQRRLSVDMNNKFTAFLTIAVFVALVSGFFFVSKVHKDISPEIIGFNYEVNQHGSSFEAHFRGTFSNPRNDMLHNVTVLVFWNEADNEKHIESLSLGNVPRKISIEFDIVYERDYLLVIKSVSPTFTFDEDT